MSIDRLAWDKTTVGDTFGPYQVARVMPTGLAVIPTDPRFPDGLFVSLASQRGPGRINDVVRAETCPICESASTNGATHPSCSGEPTLTPKEVAAMTGTELIENYGQEEVTFGPWPEALRDVEITVLDFETTGFRPEDGARPVELAVVKMSELGIVDQESWLINPECPIPASASAIHGIMDADVKDAPVFETVMEYFMEFLGDCSVISGHNIIKFDSNFLRFGFTEYGIQKPRLKMIDTYPMAVERWSTGRRPGTVKNHQLGTLLKHIGVEHGNAHRALDDTIGTAKLLNHLLVLKAQDEASD